MNKTWWKILGSVLVIYTAIAGLLLGVPHLAILNETIRNLYFHVPMWFAMIVLFSISVFYSVKSLSYTCSCIDEGFPCPRPNPSSPD